MKKKDKADIDLSSAREPSKDQEAQTHPEPQDPPFLLDPAWALQFSIQWIQSMNAHDFDRLLINYTNDVTFQSSKLNGGVITGKEKLREFLLGDREL